MEIFFCRNAQKLSSLAFYPFCRIALARGEIELLHHCHGVVKVKNFAVNTMVMTSSFHDRSRTLSGKYIEKLFFFLKF